MSDAARCRHMKGSSVLAVFLMLFLSGTTFPQEPQKGEYPLGKVHFAISCSDRAQQAFNHGVALLHHMTYPQAKKAFERVAEIDSTCAMAHWGRGMTLFQPLWPTRPGPNELQQGWDAVQKAKALASPTEREKLYIAAVEAFFHSPEETDYWQRIRRWERAMETLYRKFPDDPEAKAFFALAHLATGKASGNALEHHNRAAEILLSIHAKYPSHPGAIHYLIHANDIRGRAPESVDIVRSYGDMAPRNPHALHMPTHIFTRLGHWQEVIAWNHKALEAALEHPAGGEGQYVSDEVPHTIEYLVYAYLQRGDDDAAATQLERLQSTEQLQSTFKTAFHLSSTSARYALERRAWQEAAELVPRPYDALDWDRFPWAEAVTWFAKGLGAAHLGRLDDTRRAQNRLQALEYAAEKVGEELFTREIRVLRLAVSAWIARLEGKGDRAIELMERAAELEVVPPKSPVTPAPTLPAYELLGNLLMEQGKPDQALAAFKHSLELHPKRFNSLLGAARAARSLDDRPAAEGFYTELSEVGVRESNRAGLREAREHSGADTNQEE